MNNKGFVIEGLGIVIAFIGLMLVIALPIILALSLIMYNESENKTVPVDPNTTLIKKTGTTTTTISNKCYTVTFTQCGCGLTYYPGLCNCIYYDSNGEDKDILCPEDVVKERLE